MPTPAGLARRGLAVLKREDEEDDCDKHEATD
jgi:hypothetical protein